MTSPTSPPLSLPGGSRAPSFAHVPPYTSTLGPDAVELMRKAGRMQDPWQSDVMDAMLALRPAGTWNTPEFGEVLARQNGKGEPLEARTLFGLFVLQEPLILWTAHEVKTAMESFRRLEATIRGYLPFRKRVRRFIHARGDEGIELSSGERLRFVARSKGSGRGFSGDLVIIDEAFAYASDQQAALAPTMLARPGSQIIYASTPPLDSLSGLPLFGLRSRARAGGDPDLGWMEWGNDAPEAGFASDQEKREWAMEAHRWLRANPAVGSGRVTLEGISRLAKSMDLNDFCREILCLWPPEPSKSAELDMRLWGELADPESRRVGTFALALDVTPDRSYSTIGLYGVRADGLGHAEVVAHQSGTAWCVSKLAEMKARYHPVAIGLDVKGPAGNLLLELAEAGIKPPKDAAKPLAGELAIPAYQDVAASCGGFMDAMNQRALRHRDQPVLNLALAGAKTRALGDAKAWARRGPASPISPLVAVSLARWCYESRIALVSKVYDPLANIF